MKSKKTASDSDKRGRPRKPLNLEELKQWARTGATNQEMADRLDMSKDTLERRFRDLAVRAVVDEAQSELKMSLRAKQVALALAGNTTMLIWLGKQLLGQRDKFDHNSDVGEDLADVLRRRYEKRIAGQIVDVKADG
jgi:hypothetical protein